MVISILVKIAILSITEVEMGAIASALEAEITANGTATDREVCRCDIISIRIRRGAINGRIPQYGNDIRRR